MLDYQSFKDHYLLVAVDLNKEKGLDADPRANQQIEFYGMLDTNLQVWTIFKKIKRKSLRINYKGTAKVS